MPYKDPSKKRANGIKYRTANIEKHREQTRKWAVDKYNSNLEFRTKVKAESKARCNKKYREDSVFRERCLARAKAKLELVKKDPIASKALKNSVWERSLRVQYGIDESKYNALFNNQKGCCKICGIHQTALKIRLSVDHDHNNGKVRGLLCGPCNRQLGIVENFLSKANKYLKECSNVAD